MGKKSVETAIAMSTPERGSRDYAASLFPPACSALKGHWREPDPPRRPAADRRIAGTVLPARARGQGRPHRPRKAGAHGHKTL